MEQLHELSMHHTYDIPVYCSTKLHAYKLYLNQVQLYKEVQYTGTLNYWYAQLQMLTDNQLKQYPTLTFTALHQPFAS